MARWGRVLVLLAALLAYVGLVIMIAVELRVLLSLLNGCLAFVIGFWATGWVARRWMS